MTSIVEPSKNRQESQPEKYDSDDGSPQKARKRIKRDIATASKKRLVIATNINSSNSHKFKFTAYIKDFKEEPLSDSKAVGRIEIEITNGVSEFKQKLWEAVEGHVIREVLFSANGEPYWHERELPNVTDLGKFVEIQTNRSTFYLDDLTLSGLDLLKQAQQGKLLIYPFTMCVMTKVEANKIRTKLLGKKIREKKTLPEEKTIPISQITFKDCPFADCPIVAQSTDFEHHKKICPFNTTASTQIFYCLFIGCKKRFKTKEELLGHYKKCFFSIPGDLQKELQLEIAEKGINLK